MKSLVEFITEAISKSDITGNAKEVDDLTSIFTNIGLSKTRITKWNRSVKKVLGTNKSLYVISTTGAEKSNLEALSKIIDNGQIRRRGVRNTKDLFEITPVDYASTNADFHKVYNKENWSNKDPKEIIDMFKTHMKAEIAKNEYIKKVGITDDVVDQVKDICDKFEKEFNKAIDEGDSWFIHDSEGDMVTLFPSLFVDGKKVVKAVCLGCDKNFGEDRYKKKMDKGKFTIIFSKDDIDNLSDEAE